MKYYVNMNDQSNGDYEVHKDGCSWLDKVENKKYLGDFSDCREAVAKAKSLGYETANGCYYCCNACNTG